MSEDIDITEEYSLEERIDAAKERARMMVSHQPKTFEDMQMYLQILLARHYHIPIFDDYFKNLTIDDLIFEVEVVTLGMKSSKEVASEMLKEKPEEGKALFDDWAEEDSKSAVMSDEEFNKEAAKFM